MFHKIMVYVRSVGTECVSECMGGEGMKTAKPEKDCGVVKR